MQSQSRHFYTRFADSWKKDEERISLLRYDPEVSTFDNAILLPLRRRKDLPCKAFEGGVANDKCRFITGVQRSKKNYQLPFACNKGYSVSEKRYIDEDVVFGGVIFGHFGHVIIDSCTRLWHYARHHNDGKKRVFLTTPETDFKYGRFFDIAGMDWEIVTEPTQYRSVTIPDEAFFSGDTGSAIWLEWWNFLKKKAYQAANHSDLPEKIYMTRTKFSGNDGINEEYYEKYYQNLGYKVISPEKLPLDEQICIISHTKSIVCTMGTLAHMLVFAEDGTDVTLLLRAPSTLMRSQITINLLRRLNWRCVEATINPLPASQSNGAFLYAPTPEFKEYCHDFGLPEPPECKITPEMTVAYFKKWTDNYSKLLSWSYVQKATAIDFLESLSYFLTGTEINRETYKNYQQ